MYARFLGNSFSSPGTMKNYLSGAKSWVQHHKGNVAAFSACEVGDVLKFVVNSSNHIPAPAYPLLPSDIRIICDFLDRNSHRIPNTIKACILIGFASFLRASNLTSPSLNTWGGPHTLRAADIVLSGPDLLIMIRSTKTITAREPVVITVCPSPDRNLCPVRAWLEYISTVKPCPLGPAFILPPATPLTTKHVVSFMRMALDHAGHPYAQVVTMHSLRRGGTQTASALGASSAQLMAHGTWKSQQTLNKYLSPEHRVVPRILAKSLAG